MKKGISLYFGFESPVEERVKRIKQAGFDCVITSADPNFDHQNGTIQKQMELFRENNLGISSLHMKYKSSELVSFWENSELGDKLEKNLIEDVETAKEYGFKCVVVHLENRSDNYEIGFNRLDRILKTCEKLEIPLAFENIHDQKTFLIAMERYKDSPYAKMCYDSGHNHCFDPEFDYIEKFKDKIICLHLHDNMGKQNEKNNDVIADFHTLNKYGNINWKKLAKKLATIPNELSLDYELLLHKKCDETELEVLNSAYRQACELEELIKKCK